MATHFPPKKNDTNGYVFYVSLISQANSKVFQANPTYAAGDIKVAVDDAAPVNVSAVAIDADFTKRVKITLSQAQTNGDNLTIIFSDAAGDEWCDLTINIQTSAQTLDEIDVNIDAIKVKTDNQPSGVPKNVALSNFEFLMVLSSDHITPATGKTVTAQISKDGGAFANSTNASAEVGTGVYKIDLTQAEMNASIITLKFTEGTCDQRTVTIFTSA